MRIEELGRIIREPHHILRCMLCCGAVSQPQQLPCDHVFCRKCWIDYRRLVFKAEQSLLDGTTTRQFTDPQCPVCGVTTSTRKERQRADFTDFTSRVEMRECAHEVVTCEVCSEVSAEDEKYCVDCMKELCFRCGCEHVGFGHVVWQMPERLDLHCRTHGDPIVQVCISCRDTPLCLKCRAIKHSNKHGKHVSDTWGDYVESKRERFMESDGEVKKSLAEMGCSMEQLHCMQEYHSKKLQETCTEIDLQAAVMVREIDLQKTRLKEVLLQRHHQVMEALKNQEELLQLHASSLEKLISLQSLLSRPGQEAGLMANYDTIQRRSHNLAEKSTWEPKLTPDSTPYMVLEFKPVKSLDLGGFQLEAIPDQIMEKVEEKRMDGGSPEMKLLWKVNAGACPSSQPHGLKFLPGNILGVALYGARKISLYDMAGKPQASIQAKTEVLWPRDLEYHQQNVFVVNSHSKQICSFRMDSNAELKKLFALHVPNLFQQPTSLAFSPKLQRLVVSDTINHDITILDMKGSVVRRFGGHGKGNDQFDHPEFIAIDQHMHRIIVSDCNNHCLKVFDFDGGFLTKIGSHGHHLGSLSHPGGVAVDDEGNIFVADGANNRVCVFSPDGKKCNVLLSLSQHEVVWPYGIAVSKNRGKNLLAVTQRVDSSVAVYEYAYAETRYFR